MKKVLLVLMPLMVVGCGPGFKTIDYPTPPNNPVPPVEEDIRLFPVATATINITTYADMHALLKKNKQSYVASLIMPMAHADVAQAAATVNVTYTNPGATTFTINTASFMAGGFPTVVGNDLNMGTISISGFDDNSLRVCTGVGAPQNRCNRLYIRVFTLGTAAGGITGKAGFINKSDPSDAYGIDVFAGSVLTPIGFNASATAASVTNAATVYTKTIVQPQTNRVRLADLTGLSAIPIKADLSNAGSGDYEMNLVVQYALGYVP